MQKCSFVVNTSLLVDFGSKVFMAVLQQLADNVGFLLGHGK